MKPNISVCIHENDKSGYQIIEVLCKDFLPLMETNNDMSNHKNIK